jgi:hypothetical protein
MLDYYKITPVELQAEVDIRQYHEGKVISEDHDPELESVISKQLTKRVKKLPPKFEKRFKDRLRKVGYTETQIHDILHEDSAAEIRELAQSVAKQLGEEKKFEEEEMPILQEVRKPTEKELLEEAIGKQDVEELEKLLKQPGAEKKLEEIMLTEPDIPVKPFKKTMPPLPEIEEKKRRPIQPETAVIATEIEGIYSPDSRKVIEFFKKTPKSYKSIEKIDEAAEKILADLNVPDKEIDEIIADVQPTNIRSYGPNMRAKISPIIAKYTTAKLDKSTKNLLKKGKLYFSEDFGKELEMPGRHPLKGMSMKNKINELKYKTEKGKQKLKNQKRLDYLNALKKKDFKKASNNRKQIGIHLYYLLKTKVLTYDKVDKYLDYYGYSGKQYLFPYLKSLYKME